MNVWIAFGPRGRVIQGQEQEKRQHIAITEFSKYIPTNKYVESETNDGNVPKYSTVATLPS
jgi:hypothetical protein